MRKTEDCSAFKWADGMHLLPELVGGMRSSTFAGNAFKQTQGRPGSSGEKTGEHRGTQRSYDSNSFGQTNETEIIETLRKVGGL